MEKLTFEQRLDRLRERIVQPDFLANRGPSNEIGLYVFQYEPQRELDLRIYLEHLKAQNLPCHICECNLWQTMLGCCKSKGILDRIADLELRRGSEVLLDRLQTIATPKMLVDAMGWDACGPNDVLFITGVGEAYPFVRAHQILEAVQPVSSSGPTQRIPLVLFYPGTYDGQSMSLFGRLPAINYYRPCDLI